MLCADFILSLGLMEGTSFDYGLLVGDRAKGWLVCVRRGRACPMCVVCGSGEVLHCPQRGTVAFIPLMIRAKGSVNELVLGSNSGLQRMKDSSGVHGLCPGGGMDVECGRRWYDQIDSHAARWLPRTTQLESTAGSR